MKLTRFSLVSAILLVAFVLFIVVWGFLGVSLGDFKRLFSDREFLSAVVFGLETSFVSVCLSCIFAIPTGFLLARSDRFLARVLDVVFDIPIIIPPLIVGVLLLNVFNNSFIGKFYSFVFTFWGAAIAQFFIAFPFTVKASKSAFELVPPIYERIAMTLGANYYKSFFDTTFKLAKSGILTGLVLSWLRSLGEFGATLIVGGGIAFKTENIPINIYLKIMEGSFKEGLAASLFVVLVAFFSVLLIKLILTKNKIRL